MRTQDMQYFTMLCKLRSFSRAAQYFHVTQPTISYAIRRLEEECGASLLIREHTQQQVKITSAGEIVQRACMNMLYDYQQMLSQVERFKQQRITFGLPPILGNAYFMQLIRSVRQQGLLEHIDFVSAGSKEILQQLHDGKLDLALIGSIQPLDELLDEGTLHVVQVGKRPFCIVVATDDPLATHSEVSIQECADRSFILLDEHYVHESAFRLLMQHVQLGAHVEIYQSDVQIVLSMIREGLGIGFLADIALKQAEGLVALPIAGAYQPEFIVSVASTRPLEQIAEGRFLSFAHELQTAFQ
ncbi:LysR family transcriptional regulator [Galliscardovia ingluviei]|uniref:LysR family transcriptional regulator n=1 Tax=Galliscardovia ingluviei TaxID=1769422 RepID=A0A8J3EW22_9BIFI|nr:LysR family transcriptional regulator [Galliscardovia ingluviei]GGI13610.1 LysR family transcriptional regulator [Galliscardovia ingluviei]